MSKSKLKHQFNHSLTAPTTIGAVKYSRATTSRPASFVSKPGQTQSRGPVSWFLFFSAGFVVLLLTFVCGINDASTAPPTSNVLATPPPEVQLSPSPTVANHGPRDDQGRVKFEHLGLEDGLSQSSAICILKDSRGFMWFGTEDGLNRYDGYDFKVYKHCLLYTSPSPRD